MTLWGSLLGMAVDAPRHRMQLLGGNLVTPVCTKLPAATCCSDAGVAADAAAKAAADDIDDGDADNGGGDALSMLALSVWPWPCVQHRVDRHSRLVTFFLLSRSCVRLYCPFAHNVGILRVIYALQLWRTAAGFKQKPDLLDDHAALEECSIELHVCILNT